MYIKRNFIFFSIGISLLILSACANKETKGGDSIVNEVVSSEAVEDTLFTSPDLMLNDLVGRVQMCIIERYQATKRDTVFKINERKLLSVDTILFNPAGQIEGIKMWSMIDGFVSNSVNATLIYDEGGECVEGYNESIDGLRTEVTIERDGSARLMTLNCHGENPEEVFYKVEYHWGENLIDEVSYAEYGMTSNWRRKYDEAGRLLSERSKFVDVEDAGEGKMIYGYMSTDSLGNWVERSVTLEYTTITYNLQTGGESRQEEAPEYYIDRRRILYY